MAHGSYTPPDPYTLTRDLTIGTVPRVSHIAHLGHPLTPSLSAESTHALVPWGPPLVPWGLAPSTLGTSPTTLGTTP